MGMPGPREPKTRQELRDRLSQSDREARHIVAVSQMAHDPQGDMLGNGVALGGGVIVSLTGGSQEDFEEELAGIFSRMT